MVSLSKSRLVLLIETRVQYLRVFGLILSLNESILLQFDLRLFLLFLSFQLRYLLSENELLRFEFLLNFCAFIFFTVIIIFLKFTIFLICFGMLPVKRGFLVTLSNWLSLRQRSTKYSDTKIAITIPSEQSWFSLWQMLFPAAWS